MAARRPLREIARFNKLPADWLRRVERGQPLVVKGGAARCKLTLAQVAARGGATDVVVKNQANGAVGRATLADLVDCLEEDGAVWYMAQHAVPECLLPLVPKKPAPGMPGVRKPNAWLGSRNAFTQLHQDVLHNFVMQLHGRKQFILFAPSDAPFLARETLEARPNYSQITSTARVDAAQFPAFKQATAFRVELGPGDVLVLPAYWWHEVLTLESSLMLNYWFAPTLHSVRGVDVERLIYTAGVARRHVLSHLDLRSFASDHLLVEQLLGQQLDLLAAVLVADIADEFVQRRAAREGINAELYPLTCEALLRTRDQLAPTVVELLKQVREDLATAELRLKSKSSGPALRTRELNRALLALCRTHRLRPCRRIVMNNALWMRTISADTYRY